MSAIWSPGSSNSVNAALLSRWRSHNRSDLPGADQAALDTSPGQDLGVAVRTFQPVAEDRGGRGRGRGHVRMFHVKHPPHPRAECRDG